MHAWAVMSTDVFMADNYNLKKLSFFKIAGEGEPTDHSFQMSTAGKNLIKLFQQISNICLCPYLKGKKTRKLIYQTLLCFD